MVLTDFHKNANFVETKHTYITYFMFYTHRVFFPNGGNILEFISGPSLGAATYIAVNCLPANIMVTGDVAIAEGRLVVGAATTDFMKKAEGCRRVKKCILILTNYDEQKMAEILSKLKIYLINLTRLLQHAITVEGQTTLLANSLNALTGIAFSASHYTTVERKVNVLTLREVARSSTKKLTAAAEGVGDIVTINRDLEKVEMPASQLPIFQLVAELDDDWANFFEASAFKLVEESWRDFLPVTWMTWSKNPKFARLLLLTACYFKNVVLPEMYLTSKADKIKVIYQEGVYDFRFKELSKLGFYVQVGLAGEDNYKKRMNGYGVVDRATETARIREGNVAWATSGFKRVPEGFVLPPSMAPQIYKLVIQGSVPKRK